VQVVLHNLTGRNFQPREKTATRSLIPWRVLEQTCDAYRQYLRYMEEDLGIALNPEDLSVEFLDKEEVPV
jgi:hypothetical protein